jgi:hypothetical protein
MRSASPRIFVRFALLPALFLVTTPPGGVIGQEPAPQPPKADQGAAQDTAGPSAEHAKLKAWAGTWDTVDRARMAPEEAFTEENGMHTVKLDLSGQWLISDLETRLFGMPYRAHMQIGYDPVRKKYVGTIINSLSPELTLMEGGFGEDGKVLTMHYGAPDPITRQPGKQRATWEMLEEKKAVMRIYMTAPDGKEFVFLEKRYTRR